MNLVAIHWLRHSWLRFIGCVVHRMHLLITHTSRTSPTLHKPVDQLLVESWPKALARTARAWGRSVASLEPVMMTMMMIGTETLVSLKTSS
jgi:hypothetical protein